MCVYVYDLVPFPLFCVSSVFTNIHTHTHTHVVGRPWVHEMFGSLYRITVGANATSLIVGGVFYFVVRNDPSRSCMDSCYLFSNGSDCHKKNITVILIYLHSTSHPLL